MNTTYTHIWSESDIQWKYSKSFYQIQFLFPRSILPSPFRSLYYLIKMVYWARNLKEGGEIRSDQGEEFKVYKETLLGILTVKLHSDEQIKDDFLNLRQDMQNYLKEKRKISEKKMNEEFQSLRKMIEERALEGMQVTGNEESLREENDLLREEIQKLKRVDIAELNEKISELTELVKISLKA